MKKALIFLKEFFDYLKNKRIIGYSAQLGFGLMLAFLPMLMLINWVLYILPISLNSIDPIITFIQTYLPNYLGNFIIPLLKRTPLSSSPTGSMTLSNITLIFFLYYACARLIRSFYVVFTQISDYKETRSIIRLWIGSFLEVLVLLFIIVASLILFFFLSYFINSFLEASVSGNILRALDLTLYTVSVIYIGIVFFLTINYILATAPAYKLSFIKALPGCLLTFILWIFLVLFMRFLDSFLNYEGFLIIIDQGMGIILMIFFISLALVLGECLNFFLLKRDEELF